MDLHAYHVRPERTSQAMDIPGPAVIHVIPAARRAPRIIAMEIIIVGPILIPERGHGIRVTHPQAKEAIIHAAAEPQHVMPIIIIMADQMFHAINHVRPIVPANKNLIVIHISPGSKEPEHIIHAIMNHP